MKVLHLPSGEGAAIIACRQIGYCHDSFNAMLPANGHGVKLFYDY